MTALKAHFGTSKISFSFGSTVTGTVRQYGTPDDMLNEIILARIHGGMHFRTANVQGGVLGTSVGEWVAKNYFQPRIDGNRDRPDCSCPVGLVPGFSLRSRPNGEPKLFSFDVTRSPH